jgi:hypothetical protein
MYYKINSIERQIVLKQIMSLKQITELVERVERVEEKYDPQPQNAIEDSWASRRTKVFAALGGITKEMDLLDEAMKKHDSFQIPQIKHKIRKAHQIIREVLKRMKEVQEKTIKKARRKRGEKKLALNKEIESMTEDLQEINAEVERSINMFNDKIGLGLNEKESDLEIAGINSMNIELTNLMGGSDGIDTISPDNKKGKTSQNNSGSNNMNNVGAYEEQVLEQVDKEQQELDNQLDMLEQLMPQIKEMANVIGENLDVTNALAKEVTKKVQTADDKLTNVGKQMDEFQKEAKAANHLCYIIGFIILLGLGGVIYNLLRGTD